MRISVPAGSAALVKPRRSRAFGLPPSTIQGVTLPSGPLTSICIQEWGLIHSISVTVPRNLTGLPGSNSAANEWCAHRGTAALTNTAMPKTEKTNFFISKPLLLQTWIYFKPGLLLRFLRFFRTRAAEIIPHAVVSFRAGVLKDRTVDLRHQDLAAPGFFPSRRV